MVDQITFPVTLQKSGRTDKIVENAADYEDAIAAGFTPKPEPSNQPANNRNNSRGAAAPRSPKKEISRSEGRQMADERLKERIGIPAELADYCKSQGENFSVNASAKVNKHLENWSSRTASFFAVSQIETSVNGKQYTFCVLFQDVEPGATVSLHFHPDTDNITRSGVLCDVTA